VSAVAHRHGQACAQVVRIRCECGSDGAFFAVAFGLHMDRGSRISVLSCTRRRQECSQVVRISCESGSDGAVFNHGASCTQAGSPGVFACGLKLYLHEPVQLRVHVAVNFE
jgi:hypothetical protein